MTTDGKWWPGWIFLIGFVLIVVGFTLQCGLDPVPTVTLPEARAHEPAAQPGDRLNPDQTDIAIAILQAALDNCETANRPLED